MQPSLMPEAAQMTTLVADVQRAAYPLSSTTAIIELPLCEPVPVHANQKPHNLLRFDERSTTFFLNDQMLLLTTTERQLLRHLYVHRGQQCSRESCFRAFGHQDYEPDRDNRILGQAVSRLRKKLRQLAPDADQLIETWRGGGYVLKS